MYLVVEDVQSETDAQISHFGFVDVEIAHLLYRLSHFIQL